MTRVSIDLQIRMKNRNRNRNRNTESGLRTRIGAALAVLFLGHTATTSAQLVPEYEEPPINYSDTVVTNRANHVETQWKSGKLAGMDEYGLPMLKGFLKAFDIPEETQTLVFSKTSLQRGKIAPGNPRALYFSDDAYFGWVPGGIYELALNDPALGLAFYEVDPFKVHIQRNRDCLSCHGGSRTGYWPGVLVRSVFPHPDGNPMTQAGSFVIGHESPMEQRWGGWYVTGKHGNTRHMGNEIAKLDGNDASVDSDAGANLTDLSKKFDTTSHLYPDSDIVALMVLEHQCEMHNRLSRAKMRVRKWSEYQKNIYKALGEPMPYEPSGTLLTVLNSERDDIVEYLLFRDEISLPEGGVQGAGRFEQGFRRNRKEDPEGRSLKDFDLRTRLFKFRCSYMIYSEAFDQLPDVLKKAVYARLFKILESKEPSEDYAHLPSRERRAIREILLATKPEIKEMLPQSGGD